MMLHVCAVFDSASQLFGRPFFVQSKGVAIRSFRDEVMRVDAGNDLNKHPDDFTLYYLGFFDDSMGSFDTGTPEVLMRAKDVVAVVSE